jgi:hypothetical protein
VPSVSCSKIGINPSQLQDNDSSPDSSPADNSDRQARHFVLVLVFVLDLVLSGG